MRWGSSRLSRLLASCVLILIISIQATPAPRTNAVAINHHTHEELQSPALSFHNSTPPMCGSSDASDPSPARRSALRTQYLGRNLLVHYVKFDLLARVPVSFLSLAHFWRSLAYEAMSTPDNRFNQASILFRWGGLRMEMLNIEGSVPKEFVLAVANVMSAYTARGFCGLFNARISTPGQVVWVTMTVDGG